MDWKLTKSMYIVVFLLMNIGLIFLFVSRQEDVRFLTTTPSILEESNIDTSNVPDFEPRELNVLTGEPMDFNSMPEMDEGTQDTFESGRLLVVQNTEESISMSETSIDHYMNNQIFRGTEYSIDAVNSNEDEIIFNQYYEDYPIFNSRTARLVFFGEDGNVEAYEQSYIMDIRDNTYSVSESVRTPMSVVTELYSNQYISNSAIVNSMELGYYVILSDDDQVILRPKWRTIVEDEGETKRFFVDAISVTESVIEESE